jgi:lactate dehydrogenase-like 2-hydroxyacid dehydrogenase
VLSDAVADLTMAFILTLSRRITDADHFVKSKDWSMGNKFPLGFDLVNKTLGIVGLGRIGMKVLERSIAFKMNVIYNSRTHKMEAEKKYGIKFVELDELFRISDYISLHAPVTRNTQGLVGKKELELMKKTSFLINTSRGSLVHQRDLYEALRDKKIAGAALDVFEEEPISQNDPLLKLENVVLTPHIGSGTYETRLSMAMMAIDEVIKVFEGKEPKNLINTGLNESAFKQ